ncbi:hypothetical protein [Rhodococcus erythropolis]|uniref:hypothetical protein n=1 Tax=Rhodococcus erythropolis TaxID=1833 RepID=UPI0002D94538|nr:hypothetical protein [Rhodococcus erythropolis]
MGESTSSSIRRRMGGSSLVASMVDEHTRQSVLNIVERSIPAEDLVAALEKAFALWG